MTINNVQGIGADQWISLYYANGQSQQMIVQWCLMSVLSRLELEEHNDQVGLSISFKVIRTCPQRPSSANGGAAVRVDQPNTGGSYVVLSVPVKLYLRSGANSLTIAAGQSSEFSRICTPKQTFDGCPDYAADLDKIVVYTAS